RYRSIWKACQEISWCRMTWLRPRENGTRYLGMSPRGGIAKPPWPEATRARLLLSTGSVGSSQDGYRACGAPVSVLAWFIGDEAGSPSDDLSSKLCAALDVSMMAHGRRRDRYRDGTKTHHRQRINQVALRRPRVARLRRRVCDHHPAGVHDHAWL